MANPYAKPRPPRPERPIDPHNPPRYVVKENLTLRASLIAALLHENPNIPASEALRETVATAMGLPPIADVVNEPSPILQRGKDNEPLALAELELRLRRKITEHGADQQRLSGWVDGLQLSATPDGVLAAAGDEPPMLVEVKYPYRRDKQSINDSPQYYHQIQAQLFVARLTGRTDINAAVFFSYRGQPDDHQEVVDFDPDWWPKHRVRLLGVWHEILHTLNDRGYAEHVATALMQTTPTNDTVRQWLYLDAQAKTLSKQKSQLAEQLYAAVGNLPTAFIDADGKASMLLGYTPTRRLDKAAVERKLGESLTQYENLSFVKKIRAPAEKNRPTVSELNDAYGVLPTLIPAAPTD